MATEAQKRAKAKYAKKWWANLTPEQRAQEGGKQRIRLANLTPEQREAKNAKRRKTEEEREKKAAERRERAIIGKAKSKKREAERMRQKRATNPEKYREENRVYREAHKEEHALRALLWRQNNQEKYLEGQRDYYARNREKEIQDARQWQLDNPERAKAWRSKNHKERWSNEPQYRLGRILRNRMGAFFKKRGGKKADKTFALIGCDWNWIEAWIEIQFKPGMSWDKLGEIEIDHIKPLSRFDMTDPAEQKRAFHWSNLQPLWWWENLEKSDKWEEELVA